MQLKKLTLGVLAASAMVPVLNAAGSDEVKFSQMKYSENQDRMKIDFSVLDIKKDFGTDYSLSLSFAHDSMSGGTPIWDAKSGGSSTADIKSNDSQCETFSGLCKDVSNNSELLSNGETSIDNFEYKNAQIDDVRKSFSASLVKRTAKRNEITTGYAYSTESDFKSTELSLGYLHFLDDFKNNSLIVGVSTLDNEVLHRRENNTWKEFEILNIQVGYSRVFTRNLVAQINYYQTQQKGSLSNPYQTIIRYFNISSSSFDPVYNYFLAKEKRPDTRNSSGYSFDSAYKMHKNVSLHFAYRFYSDDWGINSNTFTVNSYINLTPKIKLMPLYRYYNQSAADFYKDHKSKDNHFDKNSYGTSDERMGKYDGITYSLGLEYSYTKDLRFNTIIAKQSQSFGLDMTWTSLSAKYAF